MITKYDIGDIFIRHYNGLDHICILTSCEYDYTREEYIWNSTMLPIGTSGLMGGYSTMFLDKDLDNLGKIGNVIQLDCLMERKP